MAYKYICKNCGKEYYSRKKHSVYCSMECRRANRKITLTCDCCGKQYVISKTDYNFKIARGQVGFFCSKECADKAKVTAKINICEYCHKEYRVFNCFGDIQKYCSRECYIKGRNENSKNTTVLNTYIRNRLTSWKQSVIENSGNKCALSGVSENLIVHHCRGVSVILDEAISELNLQTKKNINDYSQEELDSLMDKYMEIQERYKEYVCITEDIHKDFHRKYGNRNNTMEQWLEYCQNYNK